MSVRWEAFGPCEHGGAHGRSWSPTIPLVLTEKERLTLESLTSRRKTAQALALRAGIVLACASGKKNKEVAAALKVHPATVGKWRGRFVADRLDGLFDEPRPGPARTITDDQVEKVVIETLEEKPLDATHWSSRSMAQATGMSQSAGVRSRKPRVPQARVASLSSMAGLRTARSCGRGLAPMVWLNKGCRFS
jgi:transposase